MRRKDYEAAAVMYASGASLGKVAALHGITRQTMWEALRLRGVDMRKQKRYGEDNHLYRGGPLADSRALTYVNRAIQRGEITPTPCEVCGAESRGADGRRLVHAHHDDYNFPDRVRFLCQTCHYEWHKHNLAVGKSDFVPRFDARTSTTGRAR